jgi:hypothetical protein
MGLHEDQELEAELLERLKEGERRRRELSPQEVMHQKHREYHEKHRGKYLYVQ